MITPHRGNNSNNNYNFSQRRKRNSNDNHDPDNNHAAKRNTSDINHDAKRKLLIPGCDNHGLSVREVNIKNEKGKREHFPSG